MTSRRSFLALAGSALSLGGAQKGFQPAGLQLYSLRREAAKDLPGTLALARKMGFTELEVGDLQGRTVPEFARMASDHGLKVTSMMAEWPRLSKSTSEVAEQALGLGAGFAVCTQIPRQKGFTLEDARRGAGQFNEWGEILAKSGVRLCYHAHGYEFGPGPEGTLFDTLAKRMDPKAANFEMDVFWIVFGKQDPAQLLRKYPGRFPLMHLKDIRKEEPKTGNPGDVEEEASVPLGTGEVDWAPLLRAARETGVQRYYIEEEHPAAVKQIPLSLHYLANLRL